MSQTGGAATCGVGDAFDLARLIWQRSLAPIPFPFLDSAVAK
jgi:hypothetical protein